MFDQRRAAAQSEPTREQLFTERYEIMLAWALRLTNQQRDAAEDLVQDAFVQFMLARRQLENVENINGYLRRLLRNLYLSRVTRVSQRLHDSALSIADYDTFRLGWTAIEPPRRMQAAEDLQQICAYACFRKESSRAGSVLILRFFLDYLPTEIASVLGSSRHCVDQWQRLARREVKVFMDDPRRLRFVDNTTTAVCSWSGYSSSDSDLMVALRGMIFSSHRGACLSKEELEAAYAAAKTDALSTAELAHIVSCRSCLDVVNAMLALPLLAERYPAEDCSRNEPPRDAGGSGGSGGMTTVLPKRFKRRLREIREHKPSELRIAVNGVPLSSFKVTSDFCEFDLNLAADEPIEFVEILSEQGVQLLFLSIDEDAVESEQRAEIELSDGRTLDLCVQPNNGPRLHVVYNDPVVDFSSADVVGESYLSSPLTLVPKARARRLVDVLKRVCARDVVAEESGRPSATTSLGLFGQPPVQGARWWNSPAMLTVLAVPVLVGAFLIYNTNLHTTPVASSLLAQAIVAEAERASVPDQVVHRSINLEVRRSSEGALVARHTIASWENRDRGQRIQRLYDESGGLVAAAAQAADGARTVYRHHAKVPQSQSAEPDGLLLDLDQVWQLTPSVQDFNTLIADPEDATVEQRTSSYVVSFEKERTVGASRLVKATLTLARSDLRAMEQTLVIQRGDELVEYKFVVTKSEVFSPKEVPNVFEIEPELLGKEPAGNTAVGHAVLKKDAGLPSTASASAFASTELEIDVAYLLSQAKADRNEQVALTRSASGSLRVEGVVDTPERREEFLRVLSPVSNNPAVSIQIRTVAEAANQKVNAEKQLVRETEETSNTSAVEEELRAYFEKRGGSREAVDESVRSYSSRVVNHSYRALFHAVELKRLVERFARVDMRAVTPDARSKWLAMMRDHANAWARETAALRGELSPVFFSGAAAEEAEDFSINSDADLTRAIERLHRLALANNEAIGQAFTISARSSAAAFKAPQFKRSLEVAARLSNRISEYSP
ncbi:MAG: RNA polymerase sigma factor [Pyrinomonadaceae bacterium]